VWFGATDIADDVIADPFLAFSGRTDAVSWSADANTVSISVAVESDLIKLQRPNETRWTHAEQQRRFPGDMAFEWVESLEDIKLHWGQATAASANPATGLPPPSGLYQSFFP
jgi:hypothetical protein